VYGEVLDALHLARRAGKEPDENAWRVQTALIKFLESAWTEPDEGIWEMRGPRRHFTHSKVMAWIAVDRTVKSMERFGLPGPLERCRKLRAAIHEEVCQKGFDPKRNTFVQFYGAKDLDSSLLMIPVVGFLPPSDPRVRGTVQAIQRDLMRDGLVDRYSAKPELDGLPAGEGAFWLVVSGLRTISHCWVGKMMQSDCLSTCLISATMSAFCQKNMTRPSVGS
jgi:GH15 family glucan-1,4-alpha-glucosidase